MYFRPQRRCYLHTCTPGDMNTRKSSCVAWPQSEIQLDRHLQTRDILLECRASTTSVSYNGDRPLILAALFPSLSFLLTGIIPFKSRFHVTSSKTRRCLSQESRSQRSANINPFPVFQSRFLPPLTLKEALCLFYQIAQWLPKLRPRAPCPLEQLCSLVQAYSNVTTSLRMRPCLLSPEAVRSHIVPHQRNLFLSLSRLTSKVPSQPLQRSLSKVLRLTST